MKRESILKTCTTSTRFNRYAYALYIILFIYLFVKGDYTWAFLNLGVALVFDPFDTAVRWQQRPLYQKAWLFIHVAVMFAGLTYIYMQKH